MTMKDDDDGAVKVFGFDHSLLGRTPPPGAGTTCLYCGEAIEPDEPGYSQIYMGPVDYFRVFYHRACFLRTIMGSAAHIEKRCSCYVPGATENDDPNLTPREAAQAAWVAYSAKHLPPDRDIDH
jgi:hypothetical protein